MTSILNPMATESGPGFMSSTDKAKVNALPLPLEVDTDWYVDSAAGNDANDGSPGAPWATLARAFEERNKWGDISALAVIHLLGAGPYLAPTMRSRTAGAGMLQIRGDMAAKTVYATGTFTGVLTGFAFGVSAGLGANVHQGRFVRILTGAQAGVEFLLGEHTDNAMTVLDLRPFKSGKAPVSGDQFEIFVPATEIVLDNAPVISDCVGGSITPYDNNQSPGLVFRHVTLSCSDIVYVSEAAVGFSTVRITKDLYFQGHTAIGKLGNYGDPALFGVSSTNANAVLAAGLFMDGPDWTYLEIDAGAVLMGTFVAPAPYVAYFGGATVIVYGSATRNGYAANGGDTQFFGDKDCLNIHNGSFYISTGARVTSYAVAKFDIASWDCIYVYDARVSFLTGVYMIGPGTSDPTGMAVTVVVGFVSISGSELPISGGTAGDDINVGSLGPMPKAALTVANPIADTPAQASMIRAY